MSLDAERISLLYRFSSMPGKGRVLEVSLDGTAVLCEQNWVDCTIVNMAVADSPSSVTPDYKLSLNRRLYCVVGYRSRLPFSDGSFDVVVLHRVLDELVAMSRREDRNFDVDGFLFELSRVLLPGGTIAGCVENRHSVEEFYRWLKGMRKGWVNGADRRLAPSLSVHQCNAALAAAGFVGIRLFGVVPHSVAPSKLLSIERVWSPHASKRYVDGLRPLTERSRFIGWRILAQLGVSQYLGSSIFFAARRPC